MLSKLSRKFSGKSRKDEHEEGCGCDERRVNDMTDAHEVVPLQKGASEITTSDTSCSEADSNSSTKLSKDVLPKSQFVYAKPIELKLQEKLVSITSDFTVSRTDTGEDVFKIKGSLLSLKDAKTITDMSDEPIYKIRSSIISLHSRMQILDADNEPLLTLRKKGLMPGLGSSTMQAFVGDDVEGDAAYEIKGDLMKKEFKVTEADGGQVAVVKRRIVSARSLIMGNDCYFITVQEGYDAALIVLFVVAADAVYADDGLVGLVV